jgi:hypothetical protein
LRATREEVDGEVECQPDRRRLQELRGAWLAEHRDAA